MKKTIIGIFAVIVSLLVTSPVAAQLRLGVKGGLGVNNMKFNREVLDNQNYIGYTAGVTAELEVPIIGLAFDVAAMYTHRTSELYTDDEKGSTYKRNYVEIPIHAKFKLKLPALADVVIPMAYIGPDFAFLTSTTDKNNSFKERNMAIAIDVGAGVEVVRKIQVTVNYSMGVNKAFDYVGIYSNELKNLHGKDRCWTIAAAYFF